MPNRRGKPVVVWSLFIGLWCLLRLGAYPQNVLSTPKASAETKRGPLAAHEMAADIAPIMPTDIFPTHTSGLPRPLQKKSAIFASYTSGGNAGPPIKYALNSAQIGQASLPITGRISLPPPNEYGQSLPLLPTVPPAQNAGTGQSRWQGYAYSFIRPGSDQMGALGSAPQYGGGQSGAIIAYRMTGDTSRYVALQGRASVAHSGTRPVEFAAGIRIKPLKQIPISLFAERRLRPRGPGGSSSSNSTAIYAAGSKEDVVLPAGFAARGYAQGGVILGPQNGTFYDAGVRIDRPVIKAAGMQFNIGIGSWAGGQSIGKEASAARLDIGPALRIQTNLGTALGSLPVQITADWRFRIGGNARPKNGPAITVSTGF